MVLFILLWIFNRNLNRINHPHMCPASLNNCIYFKRRETNSKACLQSNHFTALLTHFILILMKTKDNFYQVWEITNVGYYHFYVLNKLPTSKSWPLDYCTVGIYSKKGCKVVLPLIFLHWYSLAQLCNKLGFLAFVGKFQQFRAFLNSLTHFHGLIRKIFMNTSQIKTENQQTKQKK